MGVSFIRAGRIDKALRSTHIAFSILGNIERCPARGFARLMQMHLVLFWAMTEAALSKSEAKAWERLARAHRLMIQALERDLKGAGLPALAWHDFLQVLAEAPDQKLRPGDIEAALGIAQYNLSRLIDRLAADKLVSREKLADDGRGQWVGLLPHGADLHARMAKRVAATLTAHFAAKLDGDSAKKLAKLLGRLLPD